MRTLLVLLIGLCWAPAVLAAPDNTISIPNDFVAGQTADADQVDANFSEVKTKYDAHNHSTLVLTGQTQGDVLYFNGTSWTRLAAGTSGQFLQTQGTLANPQWASVSMSTKVGTASRTAAAGSGAQAITGVGFAPRAVLAIAVRSDSNLGNSWGVADSTADEESIFVTNTTATWDVDSTNFLVVDNAAGDSMKAVLTSLDSGGFTITWTAAGSGINLDFIYLCLG